MAVFSGLAKIGILFPELLNLTRRKKDGAANQYNESG